MHNLPLVSCIMPTANREKFVPFAIKYFLGQTYTNSELIIVDDGLNSIQYLIPKNERIVYIRLAQSGLVIGTKRNYACEKAKGEIIVHWDDDDWYAPNWIELQVHTLLTTGADLCGLSNLFFYKPMTNQTWKYVYPDNERPWVGGATMAYKKALWKIKPFIDVQVGEDNQFVWFSPGKIVTHSHLTGFVSLLHPKNTSPKHINNPRWIHYDSAIIKEIISNKYQ